jgi:Domain of unknown function (DUF6259)
MDRREFNKLAGLIAMGAVTGELSAQQMASLHEVVLEDRELLVAFDKQSGALTRMERKSTQWTIQRRPALGVSFRLLAPLPDRRENYVLGSKQRASNVEKISSDQVRLQWKSLASEHGGVLPITFTATVTLRKGALTFDSVLENDSALLIETVDYPYFGDLNPPTRDTRLVANHLWVGALQESEIYPRFGNELGYWGVRYPTKTINSNRSQICLLQAPQEGIYVAMHDPAIRYLLQFTFEQQPGVIDGNENRVPLQDEISGLPVHLEFRTCHFAFAHPHSTFTLAPVVITPYSGDWHAGLDVYKQWRATWFGKPHTAAWAKDVNSWLQLQVNGAEQDYAIPYRDIVKYGEECAQNGVAAIQLVGWNHGGQDGGDPSLDTDPGLGTWQELHDAIAQVQAKGVRIILFGKPIFADMSTEWYRNELHEYEATDPFGNKYESGGYSYSTPTQLAGINNRRRAIMDVCCPAYRDIAVHEFQKTLDLGASGWLFDEVMQHNGVLYSFSEDHGYKAPGYLFNADIPLVKQFRAAADKVNPDFLFSGEGPSEWLMPYYTLGYYRIGTGTKYALRYIDPQAPLMATVRGFDARDEINQVLLYRFIISYEPYNFKGHVTDFPLTLAYGKKVDALRRKYKEWIWDAEFCDTLGASVTANGAYRYTVYQTVKGKRAVIVANLESSREITVSVDIPNAGALVMATPEQPDAQLAAGELKIPARSAIVVMEQ